MVTAVPALLPTLSRSSRKATTPSFSMKYVSSSCRTTAVSATISFTDRSAPSCFDRSSISFERLEMRSLAAFTSEKRNASTRTAPMLRRSVRRSNRVLFPDIAAMVLKIAYSIYGELGVRILREARNREFDAVKESAPAKRLFECHYRAARGCSSVDVDAALLFFSVDDGQRRERNPLASALRALPYELVEPEGRL